jgi:hypothetical protein
MIKKLLIKEKKFLNKIYQRYKSLEKEPQTQVMRELAFKLIKPHLNKNMHININIIFKFIKNISFLKREYSDHFINHFINHFCSLKFIHDSCLNY